MPSEKTIVAQDSTGAGFYFNQSTVPSPQVVAAYEHYFNGADYARQHIRIRIQTTGSNTLGLTRRAGFGRVDIDKPTNIRHIRQNGPFPL